MVRCERSRLIRSTDRGLSAIPRTFFDGRLRRLSINFYDLSDVFPSFFIYLDTVRKLENLKLTALCRNKKQKWRFTYVHTNVYMYLHNDVLHT